MRLVIDTSGVIRCIYSEQIDLSALGTLTIKRASYVEADQAGAWWADLAPVNGPRLGPFPRRSEALRAEQEWLEQHLFSAIALGLPPC